MFNGSAGSSPWIRSRAWDSVFILAPSFLVSALVIAFPGIFKEAQVPLWAWVVLILSLDVAHVYSTLFRTYFDKTAMQKHEPLLIAVPLFCFLGGVLLYSAGHDIFWRTLAYLAVFHFVRQQYGFVRIYSRGVTRPAWERWAQGAAVYMAAVYPLIYWHAHLPRQFAWFTDGDFLKLDPIWERVGFAVYVVALAAWLVSEFCSFNFPRAAMITGTALAWYLGIVAFNSDLAFTLTNVVAHAIPYLALTYFNWDARPQSRPWALNVSAFLLIVLALAYVEEALWDGLVWADRPEIFPLDSWVTAITDSATLTWLVPLLALPQVTHYVLDGFIWRSGFRRS